MSNNKKKGGHSASELTVDLTKLCFNDGEDLGAPPGIVQASTTSSSSTSTSTSLFGFDAMPGTPRNQPVKTKLSPEERKELANQFIVDKGLGFSFEDLDSEGKYRAMCLMSKDFSWSPLQDKKNDLRETTFREQYNLLCDSYPEWKDFSLWFFDATAIDNYLTISKQRASICVMHAVRVFQHYVSYIRSAKTGANHEMLDLSWYIREKFPKDKLEKFLKTGGGGSSLGFFCEITGNRLMDLLATSLKTRVEPKECFHLMVSLICSQLEDSREPALVSGFKIEEDFKRPDKFVYDGEVDEEEFLKYGKKSGKSDVVLHSMILIGASRDETGKVWFCVQNFWAGKYLMLLSAEYLASCGALITFVPEEFPVAFTEDFDTINGHYVETELAVGEEAIETCPLDDEW